MTPNIQSLSEDELIERGLKALTDALGPVEALRFLTIPHAKRLESVKRHQLWQKALEQKVFFDQVFGTSS
ncbi:MAG: hypothetical protein NT075_34585 [Chloroflexi bacterium]|nr:hypothetical protein [Chloroflexota bacterium]